jgi:hypothetical protein
VKEPLYTVVGMKVSATGIEISMDVHQPAKTLVPSYYCLYSLYNKIRNKGKIVSAGY